jgi:hypothetical protein
MAARSTDRIKLSGAPGFRQADGDALRKWHFPVSMEGENFGESLVPNWHGACGVN